MLKIKGKRSIKAIIDLSSAFVSPLLKTVPAFLIQPLVSFRAMESSRNRRSIVYDQFLKKKEGETKLY